jgi:hypothetical protein
VAIALIVQVRALVRVLVQMVIIVLVFVLLLINGVGQSLLEVHARAVFLLKLLLNNHPVALIVLV